MNYFYNQKRGQSPVIFQYGGENIRFLKILIIFVSVL